jgi:hypothetical protein
MRNKLLPFLFFVTAFLFSFQAAFSQCTPQDSISCPDPEHNGEVCPDTLPDGMVGHNYSTVATILPPPKVLADTVHNIYIPLHHIKLMDVSNLPPGITYQSNTTDSIFLVGTYYCILLSGIPTMTGTYYLKIVVDIYVSIGGTPVMLAEVTDSTSLAITVVPDNSGIANPEGNVFRLIPNSPNPFNSLTHIGYYSPAPGKVSLMVYNPVGQCLYSEESNGNKGVNYFSFDGHRLKEGLYYYTVSSGLKKFTRTMVKTR